MAWLLGVIQVLIALSASAGPASGAEAIELTTELAIHPLGLDTKAPRFSWKMKPLEGVRGQHQSAYRLLVATTPARLQEGMADVWDSRPVKTDRCLLVGWGSGSLKPKTRYYWTVKLWNESGQEGPYAPPAWFETGILEQRDWLANGAQWIESPLPVVQDEEFEHWARHVLFRTQYQRGADRLPAESLQAAERRCYDNLREKVWSGSLLRREFDVNSVRQARLYISGLGYYRAYLNGQKVGDRDLAPSDSHYFAHVYYQVYDVGDLLKAGRNCLGVELVNGRWRAWPGNTAETYNDRPILLARLEITDTNGRVHTIVSDPTWHCGQSPRRRHSFWVGELYDAQAWPSGWNSVGFGGQDWVAARPAAVAGRLGPMTLDPMPPEKKGADILPVRQTEPRPNVYVYDFGRMVAGRARLTFHGLKRGQRVVVRYAEAIENGPIDAPYALAHYDSFDNTNQVQGMLKFKRRGSTAAEVPIQTGQGRTVIYLAAYTDLFVSSGAPEETWTPDFTYTGFRYLEVLGLEQPLPLSDVAAFDLHTQPEVIGELTTDNARLNTVLKGVQDTVLLCFHSQLQDNNGAERNPNGLNLALNDLNLAYWLNVYPLWSKGTYDTVRIDQLFDYPVNMICGMRDVGVKKKRELNISNSLHYGHLPWDLASFYDDRRAAEALLPWTVAFVKEASEYTVWNTLYGSADHIATSALKGLPSNGWVKNDRLTDPQFVKAGFIIRIAKMGIQVAQALQRPEEARELQRLLDAFEPRVKQAWFAAGKGEWTPDYPTIQGRNLTLMYFMMQPRRADRELCADIVREIHEVTGGHQITGSRLSYPLLHELSQNGFQDEALRLLLREEYPGLLDMLRQTGNTLRESWGTMDSYAQIEGLTEMGKWFYTDLVGIEPSLEHPAFAEFSLKPIVPKGVTACRFSFQSPRGWVRSEWEQTQGTVSWKVVVPPNAVARLFIPARESSAVRESALPAAQQKGLTFVGIVGNRLLCRLESGTYRFSFPLRVDEP